MPKNPMTDAYRRIIRLRQMLDEILQAQAALRPEAEQMFTEEYEAAQRRLQPRRKCPDPLPDDHADRIRDSVKRRFGISRRPLRRHRDEIYNILDNLARQTPLPKYRKTRNKPEVWHRAKTCSTTTFSTQTDPFTYAEATLVPLQKKLVAQGYGAEIIFRRRPASSQGTYSLWTNAEEWQHDLIERSITLHEFSQLVGRTVNLAVLYPSLPPDLLDRHFSQTL